MSFSIKLLILASFMVCNLFSTKLQAKVDYYEAAIQAYYQNDIEAAFIQLKNALRENEANLPAKILLAEVLIKKHLYSSAEQELNDAVLQGADFNLIIDPLGRSLLLQGKFDSVLYLAEQKTLNKQSELKYNLIKAKAYRGLSKVEAAESLYQTILQQNIDNVEATLELASIYNSTDNVEKSKKLLDKVTLLDPENSRLWQLKGELARIQGRLKDALTNYIKANKLAPENIAISRAMASTYIELEQPDKAQAIVDNILLLRPNDLQAQLMKSNIFRSLDKKQLSSEILLKLTNQLSAIDESFMLSQPQLLLIDAMSSYGQEDWLQAQKKFQIYINQGIDSKDMSPVVLLADVHMKLEQPDLALKLLSSYESQLLNNKDYALILAGLYLEFDQTFKADYVLNKLQRLYENDESILILAAKILSKSGKNEEALLLLESSKIAGGVNFRHTLAVISLNLGELNKSLSYAKSLITYAPEDIEYQLLYARILLRLKKFTNAEQVIVGLYSKHPENEKVKYSYALLQFNKNNYSTAKSLLDELIEQNPEDGDSWFILAQIAYDQGDVEDTIAILERLTKSEKYNNKALNKLAGIYYSQKKFEKSLEVINVLLQKSRLDGQAISMKVKNLIALKQTKEAKNQLDILFSLWSENARNLVKLSRLQLRVLDYVGAEKSLEIAYELEPQALPVVIDIVKVKIRLNKLSEATSLVVKTEKYGYRGDIYLTILKGDIAFAIDDIKTAFNHYSTVLRKDDANVIALVKLSQVSQTEGLSEKFIQLVSQLVEKYPERVLLRHTYADHLFTHQKFVQAKFQYQLLITQNIPSSKRALALNNLAITLMHEGEFQSAVKNAELAYRMLPSPAIIDTLGWALVLSDDVEQGLSYLRQAFSMYSTSPEIQYHIAYALVKLNRKAEAKGMLTKIIKLPDTFVEYKLAKELLNSI